MHNNIDDTSRISTQQLSVTSNFIPQSLVSSLLEDAIQLYQHGAFVSGKIGGRQATNEVANNKKRRCDICGLFDDAEQAITIATDGSGRKRRVGNIEARDTLFDIMGEIREKLQDNLVGYDLSESMELQYLHYPGVSSTTTNADDADTNSTNNHQQQQGQSGFYKRHFDHTADDDKNELKRRISLILYLNTNEWNAKKDGGMLRAYIRQSNHDHVIAQDVIPAGGKLVLFDSTTVEHEVLPTLKERWAVVGWFLSENRNRKRGNGSFLAHTNNTNSSDEQQPESSSKRRRWKKKKKQRRK